MLGIIVQLAVSWLLVWLFEKKDLGVLGLRPTRRRLAGFAIFLMVGAVCCSLGYFMRMYIGERWEINPELSINLILCGIWWTIESVLFEELIFRGVLLYILIKRVGARIAILISAVGFGIYHWYTYEIIGDIPQMIFVFLITGAMGLVLAYAYAKTYSLYIPIALHLGYNTMGHVIFSGRTIGNQLLVEVPTPAVEVSYFTFYTVMLLPILSTLLIGFFLVKRIKQVELGIQKGRKE